MNLKVGQKVICVSDNWEETFTVLFVKITNPFGKPRGPIKGKIYKVDKTGVGTDDGVHYVKLKEFPKDYYTAHSFKPVDESFADSVLETVTTLIKEEYLTEN